MRPKRYRNLSGDSGVTRYAVGADYVAVEFGGPAVYIYDSTEPGREHVDRMRELALAGRGLGAYISIHVKKRYARRLNGW
jgi:hypothetical protein